MTTKLFKTRKLAEKHLRENYPPQYTLRDSRLTDEGEIDETDMPNICWSGETPAWDVEDENGDTVARIAWWEEGDDEYELHVGGKLCGTFDNSYDAREAYQKAVEDEECKDEEEEILDVRILCNGEYISR